MAGSRANWEGMTSFEKSKRDIADNVREAKKPQPIKNVAPNTSNNIKIEKALKDAGV